MSTFDDREKGFEAKFQHDQEIEFKIKARRNKLLGLWAAAKLGISGAAADLYAKEVVVADLERAGDADMIEKLQKDFAAKGVNVSAGEIEGELLKFAPIAREQVIKEA